MKRMITAAVAAAIAFTLVGCGSSTPPAHTPLALPAQETEPTPLGEQSFLGLINENPDISPLYTDEDLVSAGHAVCDAFDRGASYEAVSAAGEDNIGQAAGDAILRAAVITLCPKHMEVIY